MWELPGPGLEPVSPALTGGFLTTVPPEKSCVYDLMTVDVSHKKNHTRGLLDRLLSLSVMCSRCIMCVRVSASFLPRPSGHLLCGCMVFCSGVGGGFSLRYYVILD